MPTWIRHPVPRYYQRPRTFLRPPALVESFVQALPSVPSGPAGAYISDPTWTAPANLPGALRVLAWKTSRYANRIGSWEVVVPVDDAVIDGSPAHAQIKRGWHVSLVQEGTFTPTEAQENDWLLYQGVVQQREYQVGQAAATLRLSGNLRAMHLADRMSGHGLAYSGNAFAWVASDLVSGNDYIGPYGGIDLPGFYSLTTVTPAVTFTDLSRYAALLKLGELARLTLRDSWDHDRPELVYIDNPPFSGYTLTNVEQAGPELEDAAAAGFAIIGGTPRVRYEGSKIVNRVIPIGSDTPAGDLTLQYSTKNSPYVIQTRTEPDASTTYYIEDTISQARYGVVETRLNRTDIKNPSDNATTRQQAADVLYAVAVGELLKKKAEIIEIEVPVANGHDIWALPGDSIRFRYRGVVSTPDGNLSWIDEDRLFLVTERHDVGDASGVRQVSFKLAAPEINIPVPALPNAVSLPVIDANQNPPIPGLPNQLPIPDCCDDPTVDVNDGVIVPLDNPDLTDATVPLKPALAMYAVAAWVGGGGLDIGGDWITGAFAGGGDSTLDDNYLEIDSGVNARLLNAGGQGAGSSLNNAFQSFFQGSLLICAVYNTGASPDIPYLVDPSGATWTQVYTKLYAPTRRLTVFITVANATHADPGLTLVAHFASSQDASISSVVEYTGLPDAFNPVLAVGENAVNTSGDVSMPGAYADYDHTWGFDTAPTGAIALALG